MELVNDLQKFTSNGGGSRPGDRWATAEAIRTVILLLVPFAPHLSEELWESTGGSYSVSVQPWPPYDPALTVSRTVQIVVQINGKVRARFEASPDSPREDLEQRAMENPRIRELLEGKELVKSVVVPGKLVSLVIK
jgi:leucyl-tRNA synthetase